MREKDTGIPEFLFLNLIIILFKKKKKETDHQLLGAVLPLCLSYQKIKIKKKNSYKLSVLRNLLSNSLFRAHFWTF